MAVTAAGGGHESLRNPERRLTAQVAAAYDRVPAAWDAGPGALIYDRLAAWLVGLSPVPLRDRVILDVGAGTGAAARRIASAGGRPVAVDISAGMLRANAVCGGRAIVGDAVALPVASAGVDGVVAAFCYNHVPEPARAFHEAARVCRPGSPILAASFAADDQHPAKAAVDRALAEAGWAAEAWCDQMRTTVVADLGTVDGMAQAARAVGLHGQVRRHRVTFGDLRPDDLVAWRLGMAQAAAFVAGLEPTARAQLRARARDLVGDHPPPLRRSIVAFAGLAAPFGATEGAAGT